MAFDDDIVAVLENAKRAAQAQLQAHHQYHLLRVQSEVSRFGPNLCRLHPGRGLPPVPTAADESHNL